MADANLQVQLARQPEGVPKVSDFQIMKVDRPAPAAGQFLVRNIYLSLDPYQRGAIAGRHMGHTRLNQGDVIYGRCVAEVMESKHPEYRAGDHVVIESGWQQYCVSDGKKTRKINPEAPLSAYLGALGMPGLTAWAGVEKLGLPRLGETFVVSAAAGAVGSAAGQFAKAKGARVVGIAGSDEKCRLAVETFGFDACVNYKAEKWTDALKTACPNGIQVYFDNVAGPMLDAVTAQTSLYARIILCGFASQYNRSDAWTGHNIGQFVGKRTQLHGLVVYDYEDRYADFTKVATQMLRDGKLAIHEDRVEGLENASQLFVKLMKGDNVGKAVVVVGPEKR